MHIAIFTDTFTPQLNGVVTSVRILRDELARRGHRVTVFTVSMPGAASVPGVVRLPSVMFPALPEHRIGVLPLRFLMKRIRRLGIDVIHTQTEFSVGLFGRYVARRLGIPVIHTYHTMYEDYTHYITKGFLDRTAARIVRRASYWYCRNCAGVIAPTEKTRAALAAYGVKSGVNVVPTGIRLDHFAPERFDAAHRAAVRASAGIDEHAPVILFVGRLAREKSIDVIVKAAPDVVKKHPEAKLVIVGGGPERERLEALAKSLGVAGSVVFVGPVPFADVGGWYNAADIFASASTSETQGLTYAEAMAAGIAVVAKSDASLEGVLVDGVNGKTFVRDDELAPIINTLIECPDHRQRLARCGHADARSVTAEGFAEAIEAEYVRHVDRAS